MENEESPDGILNNNAFSKKENDEIIEASVITSVSTSGSLLTNDSFAEIDGIYNSSLSNGNISVTGPKDIYNGNTILPEEMRFGSGQIISIVGYGSLFMVSSIANFVVLKILIARYRKTKSRVNLLLCHLAIADLLVTFMMMPLEIGWSATVMWHAGDFFCRCFSFFRIFGMFLSSNVLVCISLDRFYAIVCPLSSGKAVRNMKSLLASAWIFSILCASPQVYVFHVAHHPNHKWYTQCVTIWIGQENNVWEKAYTVFGMIMTYFFPLIVIIITYAVILFTIYKKSKECESDGGLRRSGAGVLNRARAKTLKMTVVIVLAFIFCWTPYYIIVIWFLSDKESFKSVDFHIQRTLYIFACTNSVMNPLVYGFFNLRQSKAPTNRTMAAHHNHTSADVSHTAIPMTTTMQMQRNQTVARLHQRQEMSCIEPSTSIQLARTDSRKVSV